MHDKDNIMTRYAELIYNGYWFSKERLKLQKIVDHKKNKVNGIVKLKLYKGNIMIVSRQTKSSAYSLKRVSFEEIQTFKRFYISRFRWNQNWYRINFICNVRVSFTNT